MNSLLLKWLHISFVSMNLLGATIDIVFMNTESRKNVKYGLHIDILDVGHH